MQHGKPKLCFGDLPELDCVIRQLDELALVADHENALKFFNDSPVPVLIERIDEQAAWQRSISEKTHPGAFDRSYLATEYSLTQHLLTELRFYPCDLPTKRNELVLRLHRVMILGNLTEYELHNTLSSLEEAIADAEQMRPLAVIGKKSKDGSEKGNAKRSNPEKDKQIYEACCQSKNRYPALPLKTVRAEVGSSFGIGMEAVKKACERHEKRNTK